MSRIRNCLSEPDQFDAVTHFLRQRGLIASARMLMVLITTSSALVPISVLTRSHHSTAFSITVGIAGALLCVVMTWFWLNSWPTQRQSLISVCLGTVCVAAWALSQPKSGVAALACTAAAVTGSYIAFFHNLRVLLFNIAVALFTAVLVAYRLAVQFDVATALGAFWLMWLLNIAIPLAIRGTSKAMGRYAERSDQDALTGLLNRWGFLDSVQVLIAGMSKRAHEHLLVVMVDLDDFKRVNDTYGHAAGDRVLRQVADLLRHHVPAWAAVCRSGGEEFIVAITSESPDASAMTTLLREAIETQCDHVSASIGVACADRFEVSTSAAIELIDQLVEAADLAMYEAKRKGGNRIEIAGRGGRREDEPIG
jgi:diguanylate cyclase (GGDEF)-like protein